MFKLWCERGIRPENSDPAENSDPPEDLNPNTQNPRNTQTLRKTYTQKLRPLEIKKRDINSAQFFALKMFYGHAMFKGDEAAVITRSHVNGLQTFENTIKQTETLPPSYETVTARFVFSGLLLHVDNFDSR